jgi:twitching motility protein PilT
MRVLTESPPTIDDLKLPEICKTACSYNNGLVLVTGPTGSGKSTTLAAMINYINQTTKGHILTLEDPIEFQHESKMSMVNQRSMGQHFNSFSSAMKAALREDPDVILVGEMRDPETVALALKAAETGHLVFSTLHTNSASKTIDRIINTFPAEEQPQIRTVLSETLKVVIAQKLIPSADRRRRICVHDILVNTPASANLIREGKTFQILSVQQTGKKEGMQVGDQMMLDLIKAGEINGADAWEFANDKNIFAQWAPASAPSNTQTQTVAPTPPVTQLKKTA